MGCRVLHAGLPQSRQLLAGLIRPDSSAGQALTHPRRELHHLRRTLGEWPVLVVTATHLCWQPHREVRVDLLVFREARGPVLASVIGGGELSYVRASDCTVRPYPAGTVFVEPGPALHTAFNQGTQTVTVVGTFFDVAPGEALATPADAGKQLRLDKKCNIGTVYP